MNKPKFKAKINAYDLLGQSLLSGIQTGRLSPNMAEKAILDLGVSLGDKYELNFSTNRSFPSGGPKQQALANFKIKF